MTLTQHEDSRADLNRLLSLLRELDESQDIAQVKSIARPLLAQDIKTIRKIIRGMGYEKPSINA